MALLYLLRLLLTPVIEGEGERDGHREERGVSARFCSQGEMSAD